MNGITFEQRNVRALDDARLYETLYDDGRLRGCALTFSGAGLTIAKGALIVKGRMIAIDNDETIMSTPTYSNGYGRLKYVINLAAAPSASTFTQGAAVWQYASTNSFSALVQDDINDGASTTYEIEICRVKYTSGSITSIVSQIGLLGEYRAMFSVAQDANWRARYTHSGMAIYDNSPQPNMLAMFGVFGGHILFRLNNAAGQTMVDIFHDAVAGGQIKLYNADGTLKQTIG